MIIKTKYDFGQMVWVSLDGKPKKRKIGRIDTVTIGSLQHIDYYITNECHKPMIFHESEIFPTKEELLKSL